MTIFGVQLCHVRIINIRDRYIPIRELNKAILQILESSCDNHSIDGFCGFKSLKLHQRLTVVKQQHYEPTDGVNKNNSSLQMRDLYSVLKSVAIVGVALGAAALVYYSTRDEPEVLLND